MGVILILSKENIAHKRYLFKSDSAYCSHVPSDKHISRVKNYVYKIWTSTILKYISCKD